MNHRRTASPTHAVHRLAGSNAEGVELLCELAELVRTAVPFERCRARSSRG